MPIGMARQGIPKLLAGDVMESLMFPDSFPQFFQVETTAHLQLEVWEPCVQFLSPH